MFFSIPGSIMRFKMSLYLSHKSVYLVEEVIDQIRRPGLGSLPSLPDARDGHTLSGGEACGGGASAATQRSCVAFRDGSWVRSHSLQSPRTHHCAWSSPSGLLLLGGSDQSSGSSRTTELLSNITQNSAPHFDLKYPAV